MVRVRIRIVIMIIGIRIKGLRLFGLGLRVYDGEG